MVRRKILQFLTIAFFLFSIGLFLAYRSGRLDTLLAGNNDSIQTSPNGGPVATGKRIALKDTTPPVRMSSSKSIILSEKTGPFTKDSAQKLRLSSSKSLILSPRTLNDSPYRHQKNRLSSSKSSLIFTPANTIKKKD